MGITGRLTSAVAVSAFALMVGGSAFGQAQSKDQQKCINTLNKDTCKVAATQGKENSGCVKAGTKGTATSGCLTADSKGKVAATELKTSSDESGNGCLGASAPDFGYSSASAGNAAAQSQEENLFSDTYGSTDPTGVISTAKLEGGCQSAVTKDLEKIIATKWKQYVGCKKNALKAGASSSAALQSCVSGPDPNSVAGDPKGKIGKTLTKLSGDIGSKCVGITVATTFPGDCSGSATPAALANCLDARAECRLCLALNSIDGLSVNCDQFDDGLINGSCGGCPLAAGRYTFTQTAGGHLRVATFAPFPFPAGGTIVQDVSAAAPPACVHTTVVPFPGGGYAVPQFCVPALGATTSVTQVGCGVGEIDSNGGSDFTINENGDTSESTCGVTQGTCPGAGPAPDSSGRLDVTVGGNGPDTCASGGSANAVVTIPVDTLTWVAADSSCPDGDGTYDPGTDTQLAHFPQTLDFTTDTTTAQFADLGTMDGCKKSGLGPVGPFTETGVCIDTGANTVTTVASGAIFSSGGPTYDLLFSASVPNSVSVGANLGATCGSPPLINFTGLATRCIMAP